MKYLLIVVLIYLLPLSLQAQISNSLSLGGGVSYPFNKIYNAGWYSALHWNIGVGPSSLIDTHVSLTHIGLKDYPAGTGIGNTDRFYELGAGFRQYFGKNLFIRGGAAAALIDRGEETIKIIPNAGVGYDVFFTKRQSIEVSLQNEFIPNYRYFNSQKSLSVLSLGIAYKFWYFNK